MIIFYTIAYGVDDIFSSQIALNKKYRYDNDYN